MTRRDMACRAQQKGKGSAQQAQQQPSDCRSPARHWTSRFAWDENPPCCCPGCKGEANHQRHCRVNPAGPWHYMTWARRGMSRHHSIFRIPPGVHATKASSQAGGRAGCSRNAQTIPLVSTRPPTIGRRISFCVGSKSAAHGGTSIGRPI